MPRDMTASVARALEIRNLLTIYNQKEVAARLGISEATVSYYLKRYYINTKELAKTRVAARAKAIKEGTATGDRCVGCGTALTKAPYKEHVEPGPRWCSAHNCRLERKRYLYNSNPDIRDRELARQRGITLDEMRASPVHTRRSHGVTAVVLNAQGGTSCIICGNSTGRKAAKYCEVHHGRGTH